ncbi:protein of unknown function DUF192 [Parvibaculum lavamentivorans DS-1]|uniref:DUF192 domain-containing protein n=1 Tax=Parvibaculum lavamentivorans (strain DS-1 / DSM 13023 / NCIMB 13966) TaxID=402881 RepID=A7HWG0_PARL1|nr:DUF192 domain-containing protein [Parvibaculum lavamentivorans]ABS64243.1 protein of unknown function DUF192 [Parvibaculum lavamentivorans DS-1]
MRIYAFLMVLGAVLVSSGCTEKPGQDANLTIETAGGEVHEFIVELAVDDEEQQRGLMFREKLADERGMLFFYPRCDTAQFWMKNTYIPLDMIFIEADGRISGIERNTEPETLAIYRSAGPVNGVLEINGGLTQRLGIAEGDYVRHPWFGEGGKATCG